MAHFAQIDENNIVLQVVVVNDTELVGQTSAEQENSGVQFCTTLFGGNWIQTSYNLSIRKNYAGVGFTYDPGRDAFIPPKPYHSWLLNESTCRWESPVACPADGNKYMWDESTVAWVAVDQQ